MYIDNILIDKAEMDFRFCDTLKKREEAVDDMKHFLYKQNFDKPFIARQRATFVLTAASKVNDVIADDYDNRLIKDLNIDLKNKRTLCAS